MTLALCKRRNGVRSLYYGFWGLGFCYWFSWVGLGGWWGMRRANHSGDAEPLIAFEFAILEVAGTISTEAKRDMNSVKKFMVGKVILIKRSSEGRALVIDIKSIGRLYPGIF